jgi:hypothetical protein
MGETAACGKIPMKEEKNGLRKCRIQLLAEAKQS